MKKIGIIPNTRKDINFEMTSRLIKYIASQKCTPIVPFKAVEGMNYSEIKSCVTEDEQAYSQCDFMVVLGGDGTMLRAAKKTANKNIPILGVNIGTLGFLTCTEKDRAEETIYKVICGEYVLEKRMMLEATIKSKSNILGLNDVCVTRGTFSRMINIKLYINDEFVNEFQADGVIVSTPTGSTAYNLSAGGPILAPNSEMLVITPICPHSLNSRSFVVSGDDKVQIEVDRAFNGDVMLSVDGEMENVLTKDTTVKVEKSQHYCTIIKTNDVKFYSTIRKKIL